MKSKIYLHYGLWLSKVKTTSLVSRILLVNVFFGCMVLGTVYVSADLLGKYSITYSPNSGRVYLSFLLASLLALSLPARVNRIDKLFIWVLVLFSGVPILIPFALGGGNQEWMFASIAFWTLLGFQLNFEFNLKFSRLSFRRGWWPLGLIFGFVLGYSIYTAIFRVGLNFTLSFSDVYEIRESFQEVKIPFSNYTYKWTAFIVAPLLFFVGFLNKKYLLAASGFLVSLVLYFATGHKTFLFVIPFILIMYCVWRQKHPAHWLILSLSLMMLVGIGSYFLVGDVRLNATFLNRMFVLPAKISYEYHDFFASNIKLYLSHSILSTYIENPYFDHPTRVISVVYYDNPRGYPNTGILGDAYMNFGYAGLIGLYFIVMFVFRLIVWLSKNKPPLLVLALLTMPVFSWVNSAFLTSFFTSGLALSLIGVWLLPNISKGNTKI